MTADDKEFLKWIHDRLVNVHNENPLHDYMHKLRELCRDDSEFEKWYAEQPGECDKASAKAAWDYVFETHVNNF